jgi:hypothetical protein
MGDSYTGERDILAGLNQAPGRAKARLVVDKGDSFYFDHPLDHVPAILMVAGLLDLIRSANGDVSQDWRIRMSLDFRRFCDLDDEHSLSISRLLDGTDDESGWDLRVETGSALAADGTAVLHQKSSTQLVPAAPGRSGEALATAELSHRSRPENSMMAAA